MESKKVTLDNGNMKLEVGKKYRLTHWSIGQYLEVISLHKNQCWGEMNGSHHNIYTDIFPLDKDWIPYEEPANQVEWKTFMIETLSQKTDVPYRLFAQYYSIDDAIVHHKRAISITEIKLNIEPVNS